MAGPSQRALVVLIGIPLVLSWLWLAKTYDQFWLAVLLIALVTALGSWEYAKLISRGGVPLEHLSFTLISGLAIVALGVLGEAHGAWILGAAMLFFVIGYLPQAEGVKSMAAAALGLLYLPYLLHFFFVLFRPEEGFYYLLWLLLLVWAYDTGAYLMGSLFGKHPLFAALSPKKSWEGVLGGSVLTVGVAWLIWLWRPSEWAAPEFFPHALGVSLLVSVAAQLGDLFESKLKRTAGVKDSGVLLPGHGGMLDRIDSLLLALPVFYFYLRYVLSWV